MADLKYPAEAVERMKSAVIGNGIIPPHDPDRASPNISCADLAGAISYMEHARALIHESAKMLGHFAEGLPADNPDRQEAEALISRLGKTIGD